MFETVLARKVYICDCHVTVHMYVVSLLEMVLNN